MSDQPSEQASAPSTHDEKTQEVKEQNAESTQNQPEHNNEQSTSTTKVPSVAQEINTAAIKALNLSEDEEEDDDDDSEEFDDWKSRLLGGWGTRRREPEPDPKELWAKEEKLTVEERRKRYHCRRYVTPDQIHTWFEVSKNPKNIRNVVDEETLKKSPYKPNAAVNKKLALYNGDITSLEIDAIINAANESCLGGGGVDGAIHDAAGSMLYQECRTLHGCPTGKAKITRGYDLPAKFVIHTVGPVGENPRALASCYHECMKLVVEHGIKTVAFCGISTGIYGYPLYKASHVACKVIRDWLEIPENRDKVDKVIFCTFLAKEEVCYEQLAQIYFPIATEDTTDTKVDNNNAATQPALQESTGSAPQQENKPSETTQEHSNNNEAASNDNSGATQTSS
eukprot:CAMPEP_0168556936 /NCGR_PEP_ID=MMETSP0413-20121227/9151_1 /TAXON_ID=136452 /ORGANISM="Filamoeba nolandi, Strain NC-AS-23-1" /LENGTH=395 /DNA_ID=CAMNT_0008587921 /DNA_START=145 /DNA_END=1332 /DNA_ORIENTATION=-